MKKNKRKVGRTSIILIFLIILMVGCEKENITTDKLSELQIEACNAAEKYDTCDSRLEEVGIVLKEECCEVLGKCC